MKKLFISAALFVLLSVGYAHAQTQTASQFCTGGSCTYVPLEPIYGLPGCYGPTPPANCKNPSTGSFASLIPSTFKLLIGAGALVAIIMIVLGALTYMFSDIAGNKNKALSRIRNAMWAVVLLVSSYLILYTINPDLVELKLNLSTSGNFTPSPNTGTSNPMPATRVLVTNPTGTTIYNGSSAYDQLMNLQSQCQSPKAVHAIGNGSDSGGNYVTYVCQ